MNDMNLKICVLDGFTVNPGDLDWQPIAALGELHLYDRTRPDEVLERAKGMDAVLLNKVVLGREHFDALPDLKYVGVLATGYNNVDVAEAARRGIVVTNIPAYSTDSVAQLVFAHLLNIYVGVSGYSASVHRGDWTRSADFSYQLTPIHELRGKAMGIVGLGHIGMAVAEIAHAFGMRVMAYTSKSGLPQWITRCDLDHLFAAADVLSLHCPLTASTSGMVDARRLGMMRSTAVLINTGRGQLVDEQALADALNSGRLMAAALDVLSTEPPKADNPLLGARNCYITPHVAWATFEARSRLMEIAAENLRQFAGGMPVANRVS